MTKSPSDIVLVPYEEAYGAGFEDMPRRMPDISKIQRLIGYRPVLGLPEMLERVIAYERERGK
jgi:UDP-glucose 4-epimerase